MIPLVLDTNVLVSGMLSSAGPPGALVGLLLDGQLMAVHCDSILEEYRDVLARPKFDLRPSEITTIVEQIQRGGLSVTPPPWPHSLPDPDDGFFLAAAAFARCPLVTGNLKHYPARTRGGVRVLSPRDFLAELPRN